MKRTAIIMLYSAIQLGAQEAAILTRPFEEVKEAKSDDLSFLRQVPAFTAKDLAGKRWSERDLKGRITVVVRWAVHCLSCQDVMPQLQRFFEEGKTRRDIQLLTFNDDRLRLLVESFMKDNGYTFPVIVNGAATHAKIFPFRALPPPGVWIVDRSGMSSNELGHRGFGRAVIEAERRAKKP